MSTAREDILGGIRRSLGRGALSDAAAEPLEARLSAHPANLVPDRAKDRVRKALVRLFEDKAREVACTVARVPGLDQVPDAVAEYLAQQNLPASLAAAPEPTLVAVPWQRRPLLRLRYGPPSPDDAVGISAAFAGIAETGTLALDSGPHSPSTLNFLPETHIVVLPAARVEGPMEDMLARLRAKYGAGVMPRTVNFITGPSRTGDIEQKIEMGAHGPRRLHIVIVEDDNVR